MALSAQNAPIPMRTDMERWRRLLRLATLRGDLAAKAILEGRIAAAMRISETEMRMMWGDR
jgi:hypothetical protein